MSIAKLRTGLLWGATIAGVVFTWQVANAYVIHATWNSNSATYKWGSTLPAAFRDPSNYGASVWTAVSTSSWTYSYNSASGNAIDYRYVDGSDRALAVTTW